MMRSVLKNIRRKFSNRKGKSKSEKKGPADEDDEKVSLSDLQKTLQAISKAAPGPARTQLFIRKLKLCTYIFKWNKINEDSKIARAKENKRLLLMDCIEYVRMAPNLYTSEVTAAIIKCITANIFRALPPLVNDTPEDCEEDDPVFDPAWPHLQLAYELLGRFMMRQDFDGRPLKKYINAEFLGRLMYLFDSEDHREREYLKTIVHRLYAKVMSARIHVRRALQFELYRVLLVEERHNGIIELLEMVGSIVLGMSKPLKNEQKAFLRYVLLPLHKMHSMPFFHHHLAYAVCQMLEKEPRVGGLILDGLLSNWPHVNSCKEAMILAEIEEVAEMSVPNMVSRALPRIVLRVGAGINSPHFQVAERALFYWHHDSVAAMLGDCRHQVFPVLYPYLLKTSRSHWNMAVQKLALVVLKMYMELDSDVVEYVSAKYKENKPKKEKARRKKDETWTALLNKHRKQRTANEQARKKRLEFASSSVSSST